MNPEGFARAETLFPKIRRLWADERPTSNGPGGLSSVGLATPKGCLPGGLSTGVKFLRRFAQRDEDSMKTHRPKVELFFDFH